ncbi:MAG: 23S rRNA (uracil(1939)-C(5))-methyltransferase RlmD [Elusimicrobiota bacterium]|jgi:23S rRNA (uracil1939-C5)-methyltransferase|nr:23S rRNA (uracil(1939)-C(5))-methyltransferase RlmD [Elusimicrobiota bacterium]
MQVCKHFGVCGGCSSQNIDYKTQLKTKQDKVDALLAPYFSGEIKITPSPNIQYFRNKVELGFSRQVVWKIPPGQKKVIRDKTQPLEFEEALGFRVKGRWDRCIDLQECILFNDKLSLLVGAVRAWAAANKIAFYDQRKHSGILRNLLVREGKNTGQGMIVLIVAAPLACEDGFKKAVQSVYPNYSALIALNSGLSDGSGLTDIKVLSGNAAIQEALNIEGRQIFFELSPQAFFQTNTLAANLMYGRVRALIGKIRPAVLYDLYGGAGSFSLTCADLVGKSLCVESVEAAVENGRKNAKLNKIENVEFFFDKTEDFLTKNEINANNSVIILDPPRSGLHPKATDATRQSGVKNIFYISCNPITLAENLKVLTKNYNVVDVECFDFFPHTDHIETLASLELK